MPRDKSPSLLDENFPLTRRAPKFVRRWDEKEQEQLPYQIPPRPIKLPTPPQSVYTVLSDDGEEDEEIEVIGKTDKEDCKEPSKLLSSEQQTKTTSSADKLVKPRPSHGDKSGGDNQVELIVVEDDDDEENKSKDEVEEVTVTGVIASTEEETQGGGSSDSLTKSNNSSTGKTPENWEQYAWGVPAPVVAGMDEWGRRTSETNAQVEARAPEQRSANVWGGRVPSTSTFLGLSGQTQTPVDNEILGRGAPATGNQVGGKENGDKVKTDKNECRVPNRNEDRSRDRKRSHSGSRHRGRDESHERRFSSKTTFKSKSPKRPRSRTPKRDRKSTSRRSKSKTSSRKRRSRSKTPSQKRRSRSRTPSRKRRSRSRTPSRKRRSRSRTRSRKRRSRTPDRGQRSNQKRHSHSDTSHKNHGTDISRRRHHHRSSSGRKSHHHHHQDKEKGRRSRSADSDEFRKRRRSDSRDRHRHRSTTKDHSHQCPNQDHHHDDCRQEKSSSRRSSPNNPEPDKPMDLAEVETIPPSTKIPTLKLSDNEILRLITTCREPGCVNIKFDTRRKATVHLKEVHDRQLCFVCFQSFSVKGVEHTNHFIGAHTEDEDEMATCPVESCSKKFGVGGIYTHLCVAHLVPCEKRERRRGRRVLD